MASPPTAAKELDTSSEDEDKEVEDLHSPVSPANARNGNGNADIVTNFGQIHISPSLNAAGDNALGAHLQTVPLFADLSDRERSALASALEICTYADGDYIVKQDDVADGFYVVHSGNAVVTVIDQKTKKEQEVDLIGAGDCFGEAAIIDNTPRTASVRAKGECRVLFLQKEKFLQYFGGANGMAVHFAKRKRVRTHIETPEGGVGFIPAYSAGLERQKTEKIIKLITDSVKDNVLFSGLDPAHIDKIVAAMWRIKVQKGVNVINQGEVGDNFYVVEKGTFHVNIPAPAPDKGKVKLRKIDSIKKGGVFGELALLYDTPRTATITAASKGALWCVDRFTFRAVLTNLSSERLKHYATFLKTVRRLAPLSTLERMKIAEALELKTFEHGERIFSQGDEPDAMYIVFSGVVKVIQDEEDGNSYEINRLKVSDSFGEHALATSEPRSATVIAVGKVEVLELPKAAFTLLMGPLADIVTRENQDMRKADLGKPQEQKKPDMEEPDPQQVLLEQLNGALRTPTQGDYNLENLVVIGVLGNGSFGSVEAVREKGKEVTMALKSVNKMHVVKTKQQAHVLNEKEILVVFAHDSHPFLIRLLATFKDRDTLYFLTEAALGGELFTLLRKKTRFLPRDAKFYAACLLMAIEHIHSKCIVFRDLKPENVLLDNYGYLKIADFGFAKYIPDGFTWTLCGTPHYLAPEIIAGKGHGLGVDWWCLGIMIFEMMAGHTPFTADDPMSLYQKIVIGTYETPDSFPPDAKSVCEELLKVKPTQRLGVKTGVQGLKEHAWFNGTNWGELYHKRVRPPHIPYIGSDTDLVNFPPRRVKRHGDEAFENQDGSMWDDDF